MWENALVEQKNTGGGAPSVFTRGWKGVNSGNKCASELSSASRGGGAIREKKTKGRKWARDNGQPQSGGSGGSCSILGGNRRGGKRVRMT